MRSTAGEMEVLLEVGEFDIDGCVEMTMIRTNINVQKFDSGGGGVPGELDGIAVLRHARNWVRQYAS
jgi:hypothetical protein